MLNDSKFVAKGLTFDDVLLLPAESDLLPTETDVRSKLTREIELKIPICSAAMDTVTEAKLAIALAREGGIGIIHRNCTIEEQVAEIDKVKRSESGMIENPITLPPHETVEKALKLKAHYKIGGIPIVSETGKLLGIITNRDVKYETELKKSVSELMTPIEQLHTAKRGISLDEAKHILHKVRKEKLPIVDENFHLEGLITIKDIDKLQEFPNACKDSSGRLRVGAAIGPSSTLEELGKLIDAKVDLLAIDTAHGHSKNVFRKTEIVRSEFPEIQLIVGNVATAEATRKLIEVGADAVKVGIGPGSICTTRVISGVGVPQVTAIYDCSREADRHNVPIIADGGIRYSGDAAKAISAGASSVMIGNLLAGTAESPGETVIYQGRKFKTYRGMGSISAMRARGARERYSQGEHVMSKLVPEGIEGRVPYKGKLSEFVYQFVGGIRAAMGYCGTPNIEALQSKSKFIHVTPSGYREGHPHSVVITEEAPNYSTR